MSVAFSGNQRVQKPKNKYATATAENPAPIASVVIAKVFQFESFWPCVVVQMRPTRVTTNVATMSQNHGVPKDHWKVIFPGICWCRALGLMEGTAGTFICFTKIFPIKIFQTFKKGFVLAHWSFFCTMPNLYVKTFLALAKQRTSAFGYSGLNTRGSKASSMLMLSIRE